MSEKMHPDSEFEVIPDLALYIPKAVELGGSIPNYVAEDASLLLTRKEWKEMPGRGSVVHILFDNKSPVIEANVFKPVLWLRSNKLVLNMKEEDVSRHTSDKRRFRAAIIRIDENFDHIRFNTLLDKLTPRLGREKGNSEIEKIAKAAPVFLIAPPGMRDELGDLLKSREDLFATKAVGKTINGRKYTIGEGRIKKKSDFPHVNLWENSKKKEFDYLGVAIYDLLNKLRENDPRIKQIHLSSEYLGDKSVERRLRNSNNYLRDIYNAKSGVGIEIEYSCGCRFAKYREKGNVYIDKLGKCPSGIEIDNSELPNMDDSRKDVQRERRQIEFYISEKGTYYPKKNETMLTLLSDVTSDLVCPDNCGKNMVLQTHAGKSEKDYAVLQIYRCPKSLNLVAKNLRNLQTAEFLREFGGK